MFLIKQRQEYYLVTPTEHKPIALFDLLERERITSALVFTKSTESATRLLTLFRKLAHKKHGHQALSAVAFSSDLTPQQRRAALMEFRQGQTQLWVSCFLIYAPYDGLSGSYVRT
jgi:ATP-dependent RNA helicase DDX51/DBP6